MLNWVFLHYAREAGLDAAIVHASKIEPLYQIDEKQRDVAEELIFDERRDGYDPLQDLLALFEDVRSRGGERAQAGRDVEERLKQRIIDGEQPGLDADLAEALEKSCAARRSSTTCCWPA